MLDKAIARGLNLEQMEAVQLLRGPVCILAGAGSGKTTTITRRIANQVREGAFAPSEILAVTFTDKAAKEMVSRLQVLSVREVRARTFHAEALAQYRRYCPEPFDILGSKGPVLASLVQSLPMPYKFTSLREIATEIEWAKNRRLTPSTYEARRGEHEPPIPVDLMSKVFASYERRKAAARQIDFEDLLEQTIAILENDFDTLQEVRYRYRAFTVDEYQDVNLLQQTLLELWLGDRDDICVVGDDYQSIFGFTGASASYLLGFPNRFRACKVVTLTTNYRSTPEILSIANQLVPRLGGTTKVLNAALTPGPAPAVRKFILAEDEVTFIVETSRKLNRDGVPWEEMAVLHRINGRSEELELALAKAGTPYHVKDSVFLRRPAARAMIPKLRRMLKRAASEAVIELTDQFGYKPEDDFSGDEATRQADLGRFRAMASSFGGDVAEFIKDLEGRFSSDESRRGLQILTYHRSKGLEFTAVFLPRCEEREIPFVLAKTDADLAEERRLFYVGITRAKRHLFLSCCAMREGERRKMQNPSPLLKEIGWVPNSGEAPPRTAAKATNGKRAGTSVPPGDQSLFDALKSWRLEKSREAGVPAYVIFHDSTLASIASARPTSITGLAGISGVGPAKCERFGEEVIEVVARAHDSNRKL